MAEAILIESINVLGSTQARVGIDEELVREYAENMQGGATFPAIEVYSEGDRYWIGDGFHRVAACRLAGLDVIDAIVHQGGEREALLHAVGANAEHGLRRTRADQRRAVEIMLHDPEWKEWSFREIARRCNVSDFLVRMVTNDLGNKVERPTRRKSKRGSTVYDMETEAIGVRSHPTSAKAGEQDEPVQAMDSGDTELSAIITQITPIEPLVDAAESVDKPQLVLDKRSDEDAPRSLVMVPPVQASLISRWDASDQEERKVFVRERRQQIIAVVDQFDHQPDAMDGSESETGEDTIPMPTTQPERIKAILSESDKPLARHELMEREEIVEKSLSKNLSRMIKRGDIVQTDDSRYMLADRQE